MVIPANASPRQAEASLARWLDSGGQRRSDAGGSSDWPPFVGGWVVALAYELGASLEPAAARRCERDLPLPEHRRRTPQAILLRCDAAYAHDGLTDRWWAVGAPDAIRGLPALGQASAQGAWDREERIGRVRSRTGRRAYEAGVAAVVRAIHDGEVFQANLTHALRAPFEGGARGLYRELLDAARPAFGAYLEFAGPTRLGCILSVSPELFLCVEPGATGRSVVTRPIKGTRRAVPGAAAELLHSRKDEAELAMITDLMRNDLGRVCAPGTVRVDDARALERCADGAVLHTASTVSGRLRETTTNLELLRATFPPGSVTGAPKIRAMQIIRAIEPAPRGWYCGALGLFSDDGHTSLSVAIRTGTLTGVRVGADRVRGTLRFPVGAGIVAESDPAGEWAETLAKASAIRVLRAGARVANEARAHD